MYYYLKISEMAQTNHIRDHSDNSSQLVEAVESAHVKIQTSTKRKVAVLNWVTLIAVIIHIVGLGVITVISIKKQQGPE